MNVDVVDCLAGLVCLQAGVVYAGGAGEDVALCVGGCLVAPPTATPPPRAHRVGDRPAVGATPNNPALTAA